MVIIYRPAKDITLADGLSRLLDKRVEEAIDLNIKVDFVQFSTEKLTQILQATSADSILCKLKDTILRGWANSRG